MLLQQGMRMPDLSHIYSRPFVKRYFNAIYVNTGFIISPFIAILFKSTLVYPCATLAGTQIFCITTIEILHSYKFTFLQKIQIKTCKIHEKHPKIQMVASLVIIIVHFIFPILSCIFGILLGIYATLVTHVIQKRRIYSDPKTSTNSPLHVSIDFSS